MITNLQNTRVKNLVRLQQKSSERRVSQRFVIEGRRELSIAQQSGIEVYEVYVCEDIYQHDTIYPVELLPSKVIRVSTDVYNKIAYRKNVEGVVGVAKVKDTGLADLSLSSVPLILVVEGVEKPGNLGAVMRTADAAGVDAVIVCNQKTDIYNPNVIRSSLGCIFSNQVAGCSTQEAINWLIEQRINIFTAIPGSKQYYYNLDYTLATAIVFGAEAEGLSGEWDTATTGSINIPMAGRIDSLNISVSAAVVIYEALRQRKLQNNRNFKSQSPTSM